MGAALGANQVAGPYYGGGMPAGGAYGMGGMGGAYGGGMPYGQYVGGGAAGLSTPGVAVVPTQTMAAQPLAATSVGTSTPVVVAPQMAGQAYVPSQMAATGAMVTQPGLSSAPLQAAYGSGYGYGYRPGYGVGYGTGYGGVGTYGAGTYTVQNGLQVPQGSTVIIQREPSDRRRRHRRHDRRRPRSADPYYRSRDYARRDYAYDY